jgi:hypothetical protein
VNIVGRPGGGPDPANPTPIDPVAPSIIQYEARLTVPPTPPPNRDTPTLDDVTIVYLPRARIVYWKEVSRLTH